MFMKYRSFTAIALGLATTWSVPLVMADHNPSHIEDSAQHSFSSLDKSSMKDMHALRASKLIGINVSSKDGENLGQVQDLIFDPQTGKIRFALVGKGFMAGAGETLMPIPWQAVNVKSEREFALNVDKSKLASAPLWSQTEIDQPDYVVRIYRFYEVEPQSGVGGFNGTQSGQGQGSSSLDQAPKDNDSTLQQSGKDNLPPQ